jgi:hypothetical protein
MEIKMSNQTKEQIEILREILKWIRFLGFREVKEVLINVVDTEQKKLVYHYSDGTCGTVELANISGIGSTATIAKLWKTWQKLNLGENIPVKGGGRFKRSFDLEDFGIEVKQPKQVSERKIVEQEANQPPVEEVNADG